ncbi:MAG: hypothetical protein LQ337_005736 [Flavoplaca oasis]|nr:MAG: hypothetical protein LQ337_005736 [Flavoplaca oasis]
MKPPYPSATPTWHNDTYPAITPSRPELSVPGKTVIITGAGSGIGRETAKAFTTAGARRLALLGRNEADLEQTKSLIASSTKTCSTHPASILDEKALSDVAVAVGSWDILILNAGFVSSPASIAETPVDEWWQNFETNVKGTLNTLKAFLPTASPSRAVVLGVTSGAMGMPPAMLGGFSAYIGSKTAQVKLLEFAAAEHPNIFVAAVHPGMVDTAMFRKSGAQPDSLPMDNGQFTARFLPFPRAGQDLILTTCPLQFGYLHTSWCGWPVLTPSSYEGD